MRIILGMALVAFIGFAQAADIYKCEIDGHTAYQSSPCADGKKVKLEPPPPSYENSTDALQKAKKANRAVSQRIEIRGIKRKIKKLQNKNRRLERDIGNFQMKRESELSGVANTGRRNRFSQMTAINSYWNGKTSEATRKMEKNRRLIDDLEEQIQSISAANSPE